MTNGQKQPAPGVYRFQVGAAEDGLRLDQYLATVSDEFSRGLARRLIELGGVHVDNRRMRQCSVPVVARQKVEVYIDGLPLKPYVLAAEDILYQDKLLLVVNKPVGVVTQPSPARYRGSLYDALQRYLGHAGQSRKTGIGMVQRLDRDTSGVIIFSIHQRAHKALSECFRARSVRKLYQVLISGKPAEPCGVFRSQLARRRSTNRTVSVPRGGRYAETRYRILKTWGDASLAEVELVTGRSHQIRAHFSEAGHPLLGDTAYGGPEHLSGCPLPRQMLHACELVLTHPENNEILEVHAPLPEDFRRVCLQLDASVASAITREENTNFSE